MTDASRLWAHKDNARSNAARGGMELAGRYRRRVKICGPRPSGRGHLQHPLLACSCSAPLAGTEVNAKRHAKTLALHDAWHSARRTFMCQGSRRQPAAHDPPHPLGIDPCILVGDQPVCVAELLMCVHAHRVSDRNSMPCPASHAMQQPCRNMRTSGARARKLNAAHRLLIRRCRTQHNSSTNRLNTSRSQQVNTALMKAETRQSAWGKAGEGWGL